MTTTNIKVAAFLVFIFLSCTGNKNLNRSMNFASNNVVAHRGAFKKNNLPENSIASLKEAIRLRCTGSEFDVRMTADDSLVINHDAHFHDMDIEKTLYADLARQTLSNGEKIPTLRDYLAAGLHQNKTTRLVVELKPASTKERGERIAEKAWQLIREMQAAPFCVYISFDYNILKKLLQLEPSAPTQYLNGDKSPAELKLDGIQGADYHLSVFQKNTGWINEAKQQNIILNAWTVNDEKDMRWLIENKFDFITTNEPERLLQLQKEF